MSALLTTLTVVCLAHADVIVNCNAGLANRLRATAEAYVNLHKAPANTTVVWGAPTYACPGAFSSAFDPLRVRCVSTESHGCAALSVRDTSVEEGRTLMGAARRSGARIVQNCKDAKLLALERSGRGAVVSPPRATAPTGQSGRSCRRHDFAVFWDVN